MCKHESKNDGWNNCGMLLAFSQIFTKGQVPWVKILTWKILQIFAIPRQFFWLWKKMWALATILDQTQRSIFHNGILTQGTLPLNISQLQDWIYKSSLCNFIQLYAEYLGTKKGEFQSPRIANTEPWNMLAIAKKCNKFLVCTCTEEFCK